MVRKGESKPRESLKRPRALLVFLADPQAFRSDRKAVAAMYFRPSDAPSSLYKPMRTIVPLLFTLLFTRTMAQDQGFGIGAMVGDPTGISAKVWIGGDRAVDFGLAWGLWRGGYLHLHADHLFHKMDLIDVGAGRMPLYFGPGLRLRTWNNGRYWHRGHYYDHDGTRVGLGIRFPVGVAYLFDDAPVDLFLEVAPTLDLIPGTFMDLDAGLGVRYYFR